MSSINFFAITPTTSPEALALLQTLVSTGALTPVTAPAGQAPSAVTPLGTAEDVIASIPVAEDGHVIRSDFHNSLRDALRALLTEVAVGRGPVAPLSPALLPVGTSPAWTVLPGVAKVEAPANGQVNANGWLPLELPHGGNLDNLTVSGQRTGEIDEFLVKLVRQVISADQQPQINNLAVLGLQTAEASFLRSREVGAPGVTNPTPEMIADRKRIDNTKFKYFVTADVTNAKNGARAQINSIQAVVTRV